MAAICKEGIVICSDSRTVFFGKNNIIRAYYDESPKIFQFTNFIIGMTGRYAFGDTLFFNGIFNNFSTKPHTGITVSNFYNKFTIFIKTLINEKELEVFKQNQFFVCGYQNQKPIIFIHETNGKDSILTHGYYSSNTAINGNSTLTTTLDTVGLNKTAFYIRNATQEIIEIHNKDSISVVGGSVSLAAIKNSQVLWNTKPSINSYISFVEFAKAYQNGLIKMWFRTKEDSISFGKSMMKYYPKSH